MLEKCKGEPNLITPTKANTIQSKKTLKSIRQGGYDPTWQGCADAVATMVEFPIDSWTRYEHDASTRLARSTTRSGL